MKQGLESQPNTPEIPIIDIVEEDPNTHKSIQRRLKTLPDVSIRDPFSMAPAERNEAFLTAYDSIIGNDYLEGLVIRGIRGDYEAFSEFTNKLTELCISLSDKEIDDIVRKFREKLRSKADYYSLKFQLSPNETLHLKKDVNEISENRRKFTIDSTGIKSVASFVRARKKLHGLKPETIPVFYFENYLDMRCKIDLFEIIDGPEGTILNLIQVKSREHTSGEIEQVTQTHKDWVDGFTVDLRTYEHNYSYEPTDSKEYGEFMENKEQIENLLINILIGESVTVEKKDQFYRDIRIDGRPNSEKIWILEHYLPFLKEEVEELMIKGVLDESTYGKAVSLLEEMDMELQNTLKYRNNLNGIAEIHSIVTVAEKIVHDEIIFTASGDSRKAIKIKH